MLRSIYPSTTTTNWEQENREREKKKALTHADFNHYIWPHNKNRRSLPHSSPPGWVSFWSFHQEFLLDDQHKNFVLEVQNFLYRKISSSLFSLSLSTLSSSGVHSRTFDYSIVRALMSTVSLWRSSSWSDLMSLSFVELESRSFDSTLFFLNVKYLMNVSERVDPYWLARDTHLRWKVHGALFVQTISDVAQGHNPPFARISIVIIIIIKWLLE